MEGPGLGAVVHVGNELAVPQLLARVGGEDLDRVAHRVVGQARQLADDDPTVVGEASPFSGPRVIGLGQAPDGLSGGEVEFDDGPRALGVAAQAQVVARRVVQPALVKVHAAIARHHAGHRGDRIVGPEQFSAFRAEAPDGRGLGIGRHQRAADEQELDRRAGLGVDHDGLARGGIEGLEFILFDHVEAVGRCDRQDAAFDAMPRAIDARGRCLKFAIPKEQAVERIAGHDAVIVESPAGRDDIRGVHQRSRDPADALRRTDHSIGRNRIAARPVARVRPLIHLRRPRLATQDPIAARLHRLHILQSRLLEHGRRHLALLCKHDPAGTQDAHDLGHWRIPALFDQHEVDQVFGIRQRLVRRPSIRRDQPVEASRADLLAGPLHLGGVGVEDLHEKPAGPTQFQGNRQLIRTDLHAQAAGHALLFT